MAAPQPLLKLDRISKDYTASENGSPVAILREVNLDLHAAESLAIMGPSGSGKSTLLNIIGTLDAPTAGRVTFEGIGLEALDELALAALRNRRIGFVFQSHHLLPHCNVWENVLVPTLVGRTKGSDGGRELPAARAERLLKRVGLGARLSHRPAQLSGGERQRVAMVRALINRPALLLADEPTGSLDHASAEGLAQLLVDLNREEDVALVVVTHALDLARRMERIMELREGMLVPSPAGRESRP